MNSECQICFFAVLSETYICLKLDERKDVPDIPFGLDCTATADPKKEMGINILVARETFELW